MRFSRQALAAVRARPSADARATLSSPPGLQSVAFLVAITVAELVTSFGDVRVGMLIHTFILAALLLSSAFTAGEAHRGLLLALTLAPLIRILSLSMPLESVSLKYWYAVVAVPLLVGTAVVARTLNLSRQDLGLTVGSLRIQLLIACTGFAFGAMEYLILKPDPLIDSFSWGAVLLPALILLVGTGFTEELLFRGVMQSAARDVLGKGAIVYVSVLFAVLHIGYQSVLDVAFVFAIALLFAWLVVRTRSILGVTLSHGITNVMLFLVVPFI